MGEVHFNEQKQFTNSYILPYFQAHLPDFKNMKILEVGCAEAGFLDVLYKMKIDATGLELEQGRVDIALKNNSNLDVLVGDITDDKIVETIGQTFDLILMRDVIEHVPDRIAAFRNLNKLLNKNGFLFITFPPRFSGFAGHQQNAKSILRFVPYLHLFPNFVIRFLGKLFNEKTEFMESIILNYRIGLTVDAFEHLYSQSHFKPVVKELFLFRPIFKIRFNLTPRKFPNIPLLREVFAFGCEYLLQKTANNQ
jgi:SAM-dependent methyltransferase